MIIGTLPTTLLQKFRKIILNSKVIVKSILVADDDSVITLKIEEGAGYLLHEWLEYGGALPADVGCHANNVIKVKFTAAKSGLTILTKSYWQKHS